MLIVLFTIVESRATDPMMPLRFFTNRTRITANAATVFLTSAMAAMFFIATLYVQQVLGYSPFQSGLAYLPFCAAFVPGMIVSTQLVTKAGARTAIITGFLVSAVGVLLLARIDARGSFWGELAPATVVLSFGLAIGLPALQNAALHRLSDRDAGLGSGVQTAVQQPSSSLGLAVLTTLAVTHARTVMGAGGATAGEAAVAGYRFAFIVAAVVLVVGAVLVAALMERVRRPEDRQDGRPVPPAGTEAAAGGRPRCAGLPHPAGPEPAWPQRGRPAAWRRPGGAATCRGKSALAVRPAALQRFEDTKGGPAASMLSAKSFSAAPRTRRPRRSRLYTLTPGSVRRRRRIVPHRR